VLVLGQTHIFARGLEIGLRLSSLNTHVHILIDLLQGVVKVLNCAEVISLRFDSDECGIECRFNCKDGLFSDRQSGVTESECR
jgi:hypothetical protein